MPVVRHLRDGVRRHCYPAGRDSRRHALAGSGIAGGGPCVAELACDTDTEYFNDYGTVAATEAQINSVINTVNLQYESQVGISHAITTIIVRTGTASSALANT